MKRGTPQEDGRGAQPCGASRPLADPLDTLSAGAGDEASSSARAPAALNRFRRFSFRKLSLWQVASIYRKASHLLGFIG